VYADESGEWLHWLVVKKSGEWLHHWLHHKPFKVVNGFTTGFN
jgi:hypothetical protein